MSSTRPDRDPIIQDKPDTAGGPMGHPTADRFKSLPSKSPNFTSAKDLKDGFPAPDSPYGKD